MTIASIKMLLGNIFVMKFRPRWVKTGSEKQRGSNILTIVEPMILLHGGFTPEIISGLVGGFLAALILFIALVIFGVKSRFNREVLSKLATSQKVFTYIIFVLGSAFVSFISFYFFMFLFAWIASLLN